jgi:glycosyltransferase involved in cell wall biosynthesis
VYNVDEYLKECLDSVARQTEKNIEIICVNDGSTDRSRDILSEYAEKDPRIIIIDQENRGLSGARNTGLREATGKYIYFADSDDYIAPNTIELCVQKMKNFNLEMLCFNAAAFCDNDIYSRRTGELNDYYKRNQIYPGIYSGKELLAEMKRNSDYIVPVWSYFYRRELLSDNDISFVEGIYYEDNSFSRRHQSRARRFPLFGKFNFQRTS